MYDKLRLIILFFNWKGQPRIAIDAFSFNFFFLIIDYLSVGPGFPIPLFPSFPISLPLLLILSLSFLFSRIPSYLSIGYPRWLLPSKRGQYKHQQPRFVFLIFPNDIIRLKIVQNPQNIPNLQEVLSRVMISIGSVHRLKGILQVEGIRDHIKQKWVKNFTATGGTILIDENFIAVSICRVGFVTRFEFFEFLVESLIEIVAKLVAVEPGIVVIHC